MMDTTPNTSLTVDPGLDSFGFTDEWAGVTAWRNGGAVDGTTRRDSLTATPQRTVAEPITISGVGLHSGLPVSVTLRPAGADSGLWIRRSDITDRDPMIPARWDHVVDTRLCTVLGNQAGVTVSTVEHLMAALAGLGLDNVELVVDGPEFPVMDGSSAAFIAPILGAGTRDLAAPRRVVRVLDTVTVQDGESEATLRPAPRGLTIDAAIDFASAAIGRQHRVVTVTPETFRRELADARTFGFRHEVDGLRSMGLAQGGSLENAVVVDGDTVMNPEGLRHPDEFVRHKALDALGDLFLAGHSMVAVYSASRPSHRLNNMLLRALFARPDAWRIEPAMVAASDVLTDAADRRLA
ncbi:UDP-3-O-acyl-N-acetylglucosamine deacetylase [Rhodospira trueperi]|uniref:UDP-3-O-acyl-N-acetylglucosamine deacetylase n=1 Tax=Rhodospira trueperi TaxID=69960 RepID=A0A1G6XD33_9PROT|nr:UDP-3-O-acyl-N-acetylglucosamine deacetylase [Rhodospira trueperi]SDD76119.1 UDP-3-O-[3-hydroxymyristoyl] N-acetylglucosamine deacetylase [Rhodospira trueperi]